jgi:hypothetical protein
VPSHTRDKSKAYAAPPSSGQSIHALIDDHLDLDGLRQQLSKNGAAVGEIRPLAASLEDVFVELTYKNQANGKNPEGSTAQTEPKHA